MQQEEQPSSTPYTPDQPIKPRRPFSTKWYALVFIGPVGIAIVAGLAAFKEPNRIVRLIARFVLAGFVIMWILSLIILLTGNKLPVTNQVFIPSTQQVQSTTAPIPRFIPSTQQSQFTLAPKQGFIRVTQQVQSTAAPNQGSLPVYPETYDLQIPENVRAGFVDALKGVNNTKISGVEISDTVYQIQTYYKGNLEKNGWVNSSALLTKETVDTFINNGGFSMLYSYGKKRVLLMCFVGTFVENWPIPMRSKYNNMLLVVTGDD